MRKILMVKVYLPDGEVVTWTRGKDCLAIHQAFSEAKIVIEREGQTDMIYMGCQCVMESE